MANRYATSDGGVSYTVLGPVPGDVDSVYGISRATGLVVMVTRTGTVPVRHRGDQVRVRVAYPTDTCDQAGTLAFRPLTRDSGGVAPRDLFGADR
jgi:hypothetical protein